MILHHTAAATASCRVGVYSAEITVGLLLSSVGLELETAPWKRALLVSLRITSRLFCANHAPSQENKRVHINLHDTVANFEKKNTLWHYDLSGRCYAWLRTCAVVY